MCVQLLPGWVTTVLLAALLIFLATKLIRRGVRTYRSESAELKAAAAEPAAALDGDGNGDSTPGVRSMLMCVWMAAPVFMSCERT